MRNDGFDETRLAKSPPSSTQHGGGRRPVSILKPALTLNSMSPMRGWGK
jgi:hypothetical protein